MFKSKPKSILDVTWSDLFKKAQDKSQCKILIDYDCLDIFIDEKKNIKVSDNHETSSEVLKILDDIRICCKDLTQEKLPLHLRLVGPGCSSTINCSSHYLFVDPKKTKSIHTFEGRVRGVKVMHPEQIAQPDVKILLSEIKKVLQIPRRTKIRSTVRSWMKTRVKNAEFLTKREKEIFLAIAEKRLIGLDNRGLDSSYRNDMQLRKAFARIETNFVDYARKVLFPDSEDFMKNIMTKMKYTIPAYSRDKLAEMQVVNAKTENLKDLALRSNRLEAEIIVTRYGITDLKSNPIGTMIPGILFIFNEPHFNISINLIHSMWRDLEICVKKG